MNQVSCAAATAVKLHINIDHVATLRQARGTRYPDPVWAATLVELAAADGITVHLREDRRHIQDRDVHLLRQTVRGVLNLEMAALPEMVQLAVAIKPDVVTLVPERRAELTTEGGLNLEAGGAALAATVTDLRRAGLPVSLFIDPTAAAVHGAKTLGVERIELHTGVYCERAESRDVEATQAELLRLADAATLGESLGLHVAAGHGLDYQNVLPVCEIKAIVELNIGHAIVARAVLVGMERAVREMRQTIAEAQR